MSQSIKSTLQKLSASYKIRRFPWKKHALVGTDLSGNEYWDCANPLGGRPKRWVQMKDNPEEDLTIFNENKLPVQWQAWLRHTRYVPPTIEELIQEERRKMLIQHRAKVIEEDWEKRKIELQQEKEKELLLEEKVKSEENKGAPPPTSSQPTGHGDTFTPGEWTPTRPRR
ncbi:hypothetical protein BDB01DRAFT_812239 [Pilobolus umbonatus]|nr:hypothetical protein BDB01DRAFT_812239 [Pilobolus umbonatus]